MFLTHHPHIDVLYMSFLIIVELFLIEKQGINVIILFVFTFMLLC